MLLLHQTGSVKIGEIVRYTITYTPAHDRILPSPATLHLKIKNTSAIALRAAFVHGPYTLYAAAYPSTYNPNQKFSQPRKYGVPEFEPQLKAGATFSTELVVPEDVRSTAGSADRNGRSPGRESDVKSVSWIVEVTSQVIFSTSAAVHYEILLGRDEKSVSTGFAPSVMGGRPAPGQIADHQQSQGAKEGRHAAQPKGIYTRALVLRVDDTASLWNTPRLPEWDDVGQVAAGEENKDAPVESATGERGQIGDDEKGNASKSKPEERKPKKVHLVVLTHGLHSNLGADMLFLKESIDAAAKQAKLDARARKAKVRRENREKVPMPAQGKVDEAEIKSGEQAPPDEGIEDEEEEEVIVRGFSGNAVRTERGIKYLGKRLAKYVLAMTYPDQPYKPITKKTAAAALSHSLKPEQPKPDEKSKSDDKKKSEHKGKLAHKGSTIEKEPYHDRQLPYKITSISFISHSLGGLIQTYAVAYIQKHSPEFFDIIEPINFIAMASPFLGLSNENPLYVKFALDFGLVGRTGKDLGLTWRAPTIARSGWGAIVGGIGESASKKLEGDNPPESKPLLRILPTGPAHKVLKKFRNRTIYSNVVNDGIVPLRTSCLLFLDWSGLGRVEKARRENGLVGTMAEWGWAEITGQNSSSPIRRALSDAGSSDKDPKDDSIAVSDGHSEEVPQPPPSATIDDDTHSLKSVRSGEVPIPASTTTNNGGALASIMGFFKSNPSTKSHNHRVKGAPKIYKRSQTIRVGSDASSSTQDSGPSPRGRVKATSGDSDHEDFDRLAAPPKTTFFESAGDLLKPPIPSAEFFLDPASRPRTIFHDRIYHPADIPPPPLKKRSVTRSLSQKPPPPPKMSHTDSSMSRADYDDTANTNPLKAHDDVIDGSAMKVEEKIARAYHRDLSWRKVLVRLEPDAHNNIVVRRMFANAYGWPVIKHLCDTHFSDSAAALTRDEDESNVENAKDASESPDNEGGEVNRNKNDDRLHPLGASRGQGPRPDSERGESSDDVPALKEAPQPGSLGKALRRPTFERAGTDSEAGWSDRDWADSADETDDEAVVTADMKDGLAEVTDKGDVKKEEEGGSGGGGTWSWTEAIVGKGASEPKGTERGIIEEFLGKP